MSCETRRKKRKRKRNLKNRLKKSKKRKSKKTKKRFSKKSGEKRKKFSKKRRFSSFRTKCNDLVSKYEEWFITQDDYSQWTSRDAYLRTEISLSTNLQNYPDLINTSSMQFGLYFKWKMKSVTGGYIPKEWEEHYDDVIAAGELSKFNILRKDLFE